MRIVKLSGVLLVCLSLLLINGCANDLRIQNETQRKRIAELESQVQTAKLKLDQLQRQFDGTGSRTGIEVDAMQQKIAALEEDLAKKKALIATMQQQMLYGGAALPVELNTMLEDFAKNQKMVTYDSSRGVLKFESDLLFEAGSDNVAADATEAVKALCGIMNSNEAKEFDIIIAGHTDDMRIAKPETRQKHPTNWHLSAHRAISVLDLMEKNNIASERLSIRGFGEFRPIAENKPNKKGNSQNRRVEIYIVPKGM